MFSKQCHLRLKRKCDRYSRQFIDVYDPLQGNSNTAKQECLKRYTNDMGFRAIERVKGKLEHNRDGKMVL